MTHFKKFTLEIPWYPFGCPSVAKRSKMGGLAKAKLKLSGGSRGSRESRGSVGHPNGYQGMFRDSLF